MGVNGTAAAAGQPNVSCTCNCQRSLFPSMEISPQQKGPMLNLLLGPSRAGVRADRRHRGGDDGDGGGDHLPAEPLQAVGALLHQQTQPGQAEGRGAVLGRMPLALGEYHVGRRDARATGLRSASALRPPDGAPVHPAEPLPPFPAHLPLPAARDRPAAHHLTVRWGGTPTLSGALHPPAARPRAAVRTEPRVCAGAPQPDHLRQ